MGAERTEYKVARTSLQEAYRALKPGGVVIINATASHQMEEGIWYQPLVPEAIDFRNIDWECADFWSI